MSPLHPASLVDSTFHSKAVLELLDLPISRNLIELLAKVTVDTVAFAGVSPSSSKNRGRPHLRGAKHVAFTEFISNVVARSEVTISVLLVTLVYITRSRPYLSIEAEEWALERVFLGALILAAKYTNDSTLKNIHWALVTNVFGKRDIGRIEREFLDVLDWDLAVTESEILEHHSSIITLYLPRTRPTSPRPISSNPKRRLPIVQSEWSDSDSDSDDSSSYTSPPTSPSPSLDTPLTPPPPHHQLLFVKSPNSSQEDHSHPPLVSYLSTYGGAGKENVPPLPASLPQIAV